MDATAVSSMAVAVSPQGEKPFENPTLPPIPSQILKNIQGGRYVDMGDLLPESLAEMFDKMQKEGKEDSAKTKSRPIDTPLEWGLAFSTFAAVATHYNSERGPQLITSANIIFRLAKEVQGKVWLRYDRSFRQAAAVQPSLRWDCREPDIWLASIAEDQNVQPTVSPAEATTSLGNDSIASRRKRSLDRRSTGI